MTSDTPATHARSASRTAAAVILAVIAAALFVTSMTLPSIVGAPPGGRLDSPELAHAPTSQTFAARISGAPFPLSVFAAGCGCRGCAGPRAADDTPPQVAADGSAKKG